MNADLLSILERDNPWLRDRTRLTEWLGSRVPEPYVPRHAVARSRRRWQEKNRAHLVVGPRQAGKSTTIWRYLADVGEPALFIDCEQPLVRDWCRSAPLFLTGLASVVRRPVTLFFEEAQHLEEAGLFLKGVVDRKPGVSILVTGSSSFHLHSRTRESLAGRATRTRLLPFALSEVLWDLSARTEAFRNRLAEERFLRHVIVGGYPSVWLSASPETLLTDLVEAVILRDASDLFRIGRPDAFRGLLRLAASQVANRINFSEWASILGISRDTVASYLEILESGHVLSVVPPFVGGKRAELTSAPKTFFVDNGIRNRILHDFKPLELRADKGATLENWAFTELWKGLPEGASIHFWRSSSGAEVDFVLVRGDQLVAVEVKSERLRRPTVSRSARSFLEAYRPRRLLLVNAGLRFRERIGETEVEGILPPELASRIVEALNL